MNQPSYTHTGRAFQITQAARRRRPSGQTLVEISVMIAVLMFVAGSLLPVVADSILSTRVVRARHDAARIATTLVNFQRDRGLPLEQLVSALPIPHVTDPWGHAFLVNVDVLKTRETDPSKADRLALFVISAGPDGVIETPFAQDRATARAYGDDVIVRVQ